MRGLLVAGVALVGLASLGCSGIMGFGTPLSRTAVSSGTPWSVQYTASSSKPHQLWLEYDLSATGMTYRVSGDILVADAGGTMAQSWPLDFTKTGSPVPGSGRVTLYQRSFTNNGTLSESATVWLVELPAVPAGTDVTVSGTWTLDPNTTASQLDVVVTD